MARRKQLSGDWPRILGVAAFYFATAKLGLALSVAYGNVTPVWPPTGITLAALLLLGYRVWPGVALGAFLANATTEIPLWTAGVIAIGNTLEGLGGVYLLKRLDFDVAFDRVKHVLGLVLCGAVATTVAATIGTTSLWLAGEIPSNRYGFAWELWWFGDAMGALLVAPLLLVWSRSDRAREQRATNLLEVAALAIILVGTAWLVFFGGRWTYPHLLFPLLVWAALRFGQRGATAAIVVASGIAIAGTLNGSVPIGGASLVESVQILQLLMGLVAVTTFVLAATISERDEAEKRLSEERLRVHDAELRYRQALELNDTVVQGLAVTSMSMELGLEERAEAALQDTLETARGIVGNLLEDMEESGELKPGSLVREKPAEPGT